MKINFKKIMSRSLIALLLVIAGALTLFLTLGYTNDSRLQLASLKGEGDLTTSSSAPLRAQQKYRRIGTLLTSGLEFAIDRDESVLAAVKAKFVEQFESFILAKSSRFVATSQLFLPIGQYPERIDARDVLVIPPGATLVIEPVTKLLGDTKAPDGLGAGADVNEVEARFSSVSLQKISKILLTESAVGELDGRSAGHAGARLDVVIPKVVDPVDTQSWWYRLAGKFLTVDRDYTGWRWTDVRFKYDAAKRLRLQCDDEELACVISDLGVFAPVKGAPHNFLVVVIDTLRSDAVRKGNMPALAALADQSTEFTNAISAGNMTSPSTNAMLACQRPTDLGSLAFSYTLSPKDRENFYLSKKPSFAEIFRKSGYQTAMMGNVSVLSEVIGVGVNHGFERVLSIEVEGYDTPRLTGEAVDWLRKNGDSPFLLYVHYNGPHAPYRAPIKDMVATFPGFKTVSTLGGALRWLYQAEVRYTDRYLKNILETLDSTGLSETTTVLITADHGDQMTDRHFKFNEAGPNYFGAYFDHGTSMYNDEIQVPLLVRVPNGIEATGLPNFPARTVSDWVQTTDIGPTVLDLAGLQTPNYCSGSSLKQYIGPVSEREPSFASNRVLGSEGFRHRAIIFDNRYKYIRGYATNDRRLVFADSWNRELTQVFTREELYDLESDKEEAENLAASMPVLLKRAQSKFRDFYSVGDGYELVIESHPTETVKIAVGNGTELVGIDGDVRSASGVAGSYTGHSRYIFTLRKWDKKTPIVTVDGKPLRIKFTSSRLPIEILPETLPLEVPGESGLLPQGSRTDAYIRRVEPNDLQVRRIVSGNPMFDKILREWGYLNDN